MGPRPGTGNHPRRALNTTKPLRQTKRRPAFGAAEHRDGRGAGQLILRAGRVVFSDDLFAGRVFEIGDNVTKRAR